MISIERLAKVVVSLGVLLSVVACESGNSASGSGGGGVGCDTICDCVAGKGGDPSECMSQCNQIASKPNANTNDCESALEVNGFGSCKNTCSSFGATASSARSALCAKCSSCVGTTGFEEGFCDAYVSSGSFNESACNSDTDTSELANPGVSASTVQGWSCSDFDDKE